MQHYPSRYPESSPARPRMEARPHTVHSGQQPALAEETYNDPIYTYVRSLPPDDLLAPTSSCTGSRISTTPPDRRLSRDDTAADISVLLCPAGGSSTRAKTILDGFESYAAARPWLTTDQAGLEFNRLCNAEMLGEREERTPAPVDLNPAWRAHAIREQEEWAREAEREEPMFGSLRQGDSLGRRMSRSYKEKMSDLRENFSKRAPRMRRASTPQNAEASTTHALSERQLNAGPVSPSKRVSRYGDPRQRKYPFRSLVHNTSTGDRKDTPAPAANNILARRPMWPAGGEGARQSAAAAAAHKAPEFVDPYYITEDPAELASRRGRVGSLSSAADSGADLSNLEEYHSSHDSVGEYDLDADMDFDMTNIEPEKIDFVSTGKLPTEICLQVFEYLDGMDLERAKHAGPAWEELCGRTSVWRTAYLRRWGRQIHTDPAPVLVGGAGVGRPNKPDQHWREMYKSRMELERNWRRGATDAGKAIYLSGHTDSVYCVQFDEEKIITGSRDRTIRVWDINTYQCIKVIGGPNVRPTLGPKVLRTVDYPSFHLATASVNGTAYGNNIYHVPSEWHDASILCLQYDEKILVTGSSDSDLLVWDIKTYQPIKRLKRHTGGVLDVALDAKHIVSCSKDSRIIVWDRKTLEYKGELTGHRGPVNAVQLRGKYLVSASGDGIARMWDIEEMKLYKEFGQKERGLAAVEFSEDMQHVLAGGNDNITYKFEVATGNEVMQYTGHSQLVRSLWLDSANKRVVSGSYDLDLRVYDFETGVEIWRAEEWTTSWMLAAKSDYRRIVATSQDGRILVVDFGLKKSGQSDGQPLDNVDLLRGVENTSEIKWRRINWK